MQADALPPMRVGGRSSGGFDLRRVPTAGGVCRVSAYAHTLADRVAVVDAWAVPDIGRVTRVRGRIVLDFSPHLRGSKRYLWTLGGRRFVSEEQAEEIRQIICVDSRHAPLEDAIARFRGQRSRTHRATDVIDRYLEAAPGLVSERTDRRLSPRTVAAYRAVLGRSRSFFVGMTIAQATQTATLRQFKAWFQLPEEMGGRGLQSDHEARNAFAAFRAVVAWYRTTRPDFPAPDWPTMPTALTAKRRSRHRREQARLTMPEVVRTIDALPADRQAIYWVMFYAGARPTEARGVLVADWARPRLTICRSAATKAGGCEIRDTTKTGETGVYTLPDWLCDMIDQKRASIDPEAPLFQNFDPRAPRGVFSDDSIRDAWFSACDRSGVPRVSVYRAMKHTQVSALRDAGLSIEEIVDQYRWTSAGMLEHYDEAKDQRRGGVVARLDEMVGKARGE